MNNSTMFAADRTTHLKIVAISRFASIVVMGVALLADRNHAGRGQIAGAVSGPAFKTGRPYVTARSDSTVTG